MVGFINSRQCILRMVVSRTLPAIFGNTVCSIRMIEGDDWVFTDRRFDLLHATDDKVLSFLCETVHPVVRIDEEELGKLVYHYNHHLEVDGWQIVEGGKISGKRFFVPHRMGRRARILDEPVGWQKVQDLISEARELLQGWTVSTGRQCMPRCSHLRSKRVASDRAGNHVGIARRKCPSNTRYILESETGRQIQ